MLLLSDLPLFLEKTDLIAELFEISQKEKINNCNKEDLLRPEKSIEQNEREQLKRLKDKRTKLMLDE